MRGCGSARGRACHTRIVCEDRCLSQQLRLHQPLFSESIEETQREALDPWKRSLHRKCSAMEQAVARCVRSSLPRNARSTSLNTKYDCLHFHRTSEEVTTHVPLLPRFAHHAGRRAYNALEILSRGGQGPLMITARPRPGLSGHCVTDTVHPFEVGRACGPTAKYSPLVMA